MKKKILAILFAGLLLLSATACSTSRNNNHSSGTDTTDTQYTPFPGQYTSAATGTDGEPIISTEPVTQAPAGDIDEPNAAFNAVSKKVVVLTAVATVRSDTLVNDTTGIGWPKEGTEFEVNGESQNWYRLTYNGKTAYIAKSVVFDSSLLEGFTEVNETIEISDNVNVRSVPSATSKDSIRGILNKGAKVTRVGISAKWSIILYEVVSETETDASGNKAKETKRYYISNDCIVDPTAATTAQ